MSFAPTDAAIEGFRLVRARPGLVLAWSAFYFVGLLAMIAVLLIGLWPKLAPLAPMAGIPGGGRNFGQMQERFGLSILVVVPMALIMLTMLSTAVYRAVLRPQEQALFYLRLGADEFRLLALNLIMFGLTALVSTLFGAVVLGLSQVLGHLLGGVVTVLGSFAGLILAVWAGVRMSLVGPIAFAERKIRLLGAWQETGGRFWPLLTMWLLTLLAVFAVFVGAAVLGGAGAWLLGAGNLLREFTDGDPALMSPGTARIALVIFLLQQAIAVLVIVLASVIGHAAMARGYDRIASHP